MKDIQAKLDPAEMSALKKQVSDQSSAFKASDATKKMDLVAGDSAKTAIIGANLDPK